KEYIVKGNSTLIQLVVSIILFFVIFFGLAFILNMLLRRTWLMAIIYPFIVVLIVNDASFVDYFTSPMVSFSSVFMLFVLILVVDIFFFSSGLFCTLVSLCVL